MSEVAATASPITEAPPTTEVPEAPVGPLNAAQGAQLLAQLRSKAEPKSEAPAKEPVRAVEPPKDAPAEKESAPTGADTEAPQQPPGETANDDGADEPPIDPPRTWPKAEKEVFKTLPRETQRKLVEIDKARDAEIQKGLRENADRERALETQRAAMEEARKHYETRVPAIVQQLQGELAQKFGDIKSMDDVVNLARTNPARHGEFQALVQRTQARMAEQQQMDARKQQEAEQWLQTFVAGEDAKFLEAAPEFGDPKKAQQLQNEAVELLEEKGFSKEEIEALWAGRKPLMARDHRFQLLVRDAAKYRAAQKALPSAKAPSSQPAVKPGIPPSKGERRASTVTALEQKLARTGKPQDAVELLRAKRAS